MTDIDQNKTDQIARLIGYVEGLDTTDIMNVGDRSVTQLVDDWMQVGLIESLPDPSSITLDADRINIDAHLTISLRSGATQTASVRVAGSVEDDIVGIYNMTLIAPMQG